MQIYRKSGRSFEISSTINVCHLKQLICSDVHLGSEHGHTMREKIVLKLRTSRDCPRLHNNDYCNQTMALSDHISHDSRVSFEATLVKDFKKAIKKFFGYARNKLALRHMYTKGM